MNHILDLDQHLCQDSLQDWLPGSSKVWTFLFWRTGYRGKGRDNSGDTVEDVRRFTDQNGWTRLVSRHSLHLGKIFLLLHLPVLETKEKQRQGRVFIIGVLDFVSSFFPPHFKIHALVWCQSCCQGLYHIFLFCNRKKKPMLFLCVVYFCMS